MIKLHRGAAPNFWTRENVRKWTDSWLAKNCKSDKWYWPVVEGQGINKYAVEAMESWHYNKCAFCETPLSSGREIEHFRSKTGYPLSAFVWRNWFLICRDCNQAKGSKNHAGCIKPDREDPEAYLRVNRTSLKIEPRLGISEDFHRKAVTTIELYKLNSREKMKLRAYYGQLVFDGFGEGAERPFSLMAKSILDS